MSISNRNLVSESCTIFDKISLERIHYWLWRVKFNYNELSIFRNHLNGIRPEDEKIIYIMESDALCRYDVILSDEEVCFLRLAMTKAEFEWVGAAPGQPEWR